MPNFVDLTVDFGVVVLSNKLCISAEDMFPNLNLSFDSSIFRTFRVVEQNNMHCKHAAVRHIRSYRGICSDKQQNYFEPIRNLKAQYPRNCLLII